MHFWFKQKIHCHFFLLPLGLPFGWALLATTSPSAGCLFTASPLGHHLSIMLKTPWYTSRVAKHNKCVAALHTSVLRSQLYTFVLSESRQDGMETRCGNVRRCMMHLVMCHLFATTWSPFGSLLATVWPPPALSIAIPIIYLCNCSSLMSLISLLHSLATLAPPVFCTWWETNEIQCTTARCSPVVAKVMSVLPELYTDMFEQAHSRSASVEGSWTLHHQPVRVLSVGKRQWSSKGKEREKGRKKGC